MDQGRETMKILQVTQRFNPSISGSQYHVYRISRELIKRGHDVTVVSTNSMHNKDVRGFSTSRPFSLASTLLNLPKEEVIDGIKVYRFQPVFQFWMYMINPSMFFFLLKKINQFDVVHGHVYMSAEASMAAKASKLRNIPFVFTAHDLVSPHDGYINTLKTIYDKTDGAITLGIANKLIALTNENKKQYDILGIPEKKIEIVPNGIDYWQFCNPKNKKASQGKLSSGERIVLFVGRLVRYKGAQYILEAIPNIIIDFPNTKFIFIGEDQGYKQDLVELARNLGVFNKCQFLGKVSDSDLRYYYSISDIFVLPSIGEGFGLVALEAIASGIPVILADTGGLKHILAEVGGYPINMKKDIPNQISNIIKSVFLNPIPEHELRRRQLILKDNYSWESVAEMLESIYTEAIT